MIPKVMRCALAAICAISVLAGCDASQSVLECPETVVVYSAGSVIEYGDTDNEFWTEYERFKNAKLTGVLETAIDSDLVFLQKQNDCMEFVYDDLQHLEQRDGSTRNYDKLLFCLEGPLTDEVILGVNDDYLSGTYPI